MLAAADEVFKGIESLCSEPTKGKCRIQTLKIAQVLKCKPAEALEKLI
jgi:hypothetical protein